MKTCNRKQFLKAKKKSSYNFLLKLTQGTCIVSVLFVFKQHLALCQNRYSIYDTGGGGDL